MATWLAITAAVLHFLHSVGLEQTLGKFGLISRVRLQRLTEAAHVGCALKLIIELGADAPLVVSFVGTGKQCSADYSNEVEHACMDALEDALCKVQTHQAAQVSSSSCSAGFPLCGATSLPSHTFIAVFAQNLVATVQLPVVEWHPYRMLKC